MPRKYTKKKGGSARPKRAKLQVLLVVAVAVEAIVVLRDKEQKVQEQVP